MTKYVVTMAADDSRKPGWKPVYMVATVVNGEKLYEWSLRLSEATVFRSRTGARLEARNELASRGLGSRVNLPCDVVAIH